MSSRSKLNRINEHLPSWSLSGRQLLGVAAAIHLLLTVVVFIAGRVGIAPRLIDRDGIMPSFAFDSYDYQRGAIALAELLQGGHFGQWASAAQPVHVKILALPFALLGPVFGYGNLSAEPYNLAFYVILLTLVFAIGREVSGRRVGLLAATTVAVFPTFLLHTLQLLKEPLFVSIALAFLLSVITLLTRTYKPVAAVGISILTALAVLVLSIIRVNFVLVLIAAASIGLVLLVVRQILERKLLLWNIAIPVTVLLTSLPLILLSSQQTIEATKHYPSDQSGQPKTAVNSVAQKPTMITVIAQAGKGGSRVTRSTAALDRQARRVSSMRSRFAGAYPEAGSVLDGYTEFRTLGGLFAYLPRAMEIGLWAPFPSMWFSAGRRVGHLGTLLSGAETFLIYLFQLMALVAIAREPRRLALWFLVGIAVLGVTAIALVVPNVGALYRFRYVFWVLFVIAGITGLNGLAVTYATRWRTQTLLENLLVTEVSK